MKKVGIITLGCSKNTVDAEVMAGLLREANYELSSEANAEIVIVNTCGFISAAKEESVDTILEVAQWKESGQCQYLIVTGCLAQRYPKELARELPEVDLFLGLDDVPHIAKACDELIGKHSPEERAHRLSLNLASQGAYQSTYLYSHTTPRINLGPKHTAYVKIAEGCDYTCTFCAIPSMRGLFRSRSVSSIVEEVKILAGQGVKEINLIAQDTTAYGKDQGKESGLHRLLEELVKVEDIKWIRFLYAYPTSVRKSLMEVLAREPKLCKYIDLPLQHIDDDLLKAMKRPGSSKKVKELLQMIRETIPGVTLRTTFIVGFPGETEEAFERLVEFVQETRFDRVGVFKYSREEGTEAASLNKNISAKVKDKRYRRLMKVQATVSREKNKALIGTRQHILVDGVSPETPLLLMGRMQGQAPEIDGVVYLNEGQTEQGRIEDVEITEAHTYDLIGRIL
jgi:ribosomal protein S12 methylthiotransferase